MVVINAAKQGIGNQVRQKLGSPSAYGTRGYGAHQYGAGDRFLGIYQIRTRYGKQVQVKEKYYTPKNRQTDLQQAHRQKYG